MNDTLFTLSSWPQAIVHIDGDAFFTSCEEAIHPELKGNPVITGAERGIVACASYRAKELGVKRGVSLSEARRLCPGLVVLPSDYETYSLFSRRMFTIVRRFTPQVEEYSIDEAFADITVCGVPLRISYEAIVPKIMARDPEGTRFYRFVGLSLTKVPGQGGLKVPEAGSTDRHPGPPSPFISRGFPWKKIWGIGPATAAYLRWASAPPWISPGWRSGGPGPPDQAGTGDLGRKSAAIGLSRRCRGKSVYASISKTRTFAPATTDADYLFAQLLRNLESACIKARRYRLAPQRDRPLLKTENFSCWGGEVRLNRPSSYPLELSGPLRAAFHDLYRPGTRCRATGVVLMELGPDMPVQFSLFDDALKAEKVRSLYEVVDEISRRFGKHSLHLGGSHDMEVVGKGKRGVPTARETTRLFGETKRRHLGLPVWHGKV